MSISRVTVFHVMATHGLWLQEDLQAADYFKFSIGVRRGSTLSSEGRIKGKNESTAMM